MLLDGRGFVVSYNHATEQLLGVARAEALDRHFTTLITPESRRLQADELQELIRSAAEERPKTTEITIRPVAAAPRVIELSTSTWGSGADRRYALIAQDVSERRRAEQQIAQLAYTHRVSGLPNEPALLAALARPAPTPRGFVALELSRLQRVREIFGSEGSDAVVRAVATRLGSGPAKVTAYHLTRAEFMLVVEDTDRCELQALAARACATLQAPLEVQGATLYLKYAAGTALVDARGDGRAGIDEALRGLQRARETDSPRPCFYDAADPPDRGRLRREADLHGAVSRGELCLHYQPIVELATGDVRAFEALVRWRHPELGLLPPAMFVDLAEESGLIVEIGRWVIDESCRQLAGWRRAHGFAGRMSFNVAPRQLLSDDLARVVAEATARHGVDPALLVAEVVESAALRDLSGARRTLESLRDLGMWIALDDFGAGESSLGRLADLPVQVLKLDRSLTRGLPDARASRAVTRSAAHLAHELGLSLVSEGVETDAQRGHLRGLPGRFAQGFLFGRPLPAADAIRLA